MADPAARSLAFAAPPLVCVPVANSADLFPVRRIHCVGRNYAAHAREMGGDGREPPFFFQKPTDAIVTSGSVIEYPPATRSFQHEVELVLAVGAAGNRIPVQHARNHIFGFAVGVDLTRRDLQLRARAAGRPWESGKSFDRSAPISPILRADAARVRPESVISLQVNGTVRQRAVLAEMIWSCAEIVHELSSLYRLEAGDLIFTGTPAGVGDLEPGDWVESDITGVGHVEFRVAPAAGAPQYSPP